ncbi:MAG: DUF4255 domain-containing protein [Candidatus Electrothrix sp. Rat3]|nr:DUF4255 domain-containing protein [Candidatus Electrothrix rattekaaiensis]
MISHALTIVANELHKHLTDNYNMSSEDPSVKLGNLAEGFTGNHDREMLYISVVNIKEEKTLKNLPHRVSDSASLRVTYENPPVFINLLILITAAHKDYTNALLMLSRAILFFQCNNVITQDNVDPESISKDEPLNTLDRLESFKLIFDLYSPSMEEVNHLWGTLGGKQYPFVLYKLRMLDLQFKSVQGQGGVVEEVITNFSHKTE